MSVRIVGEYLDCSVRAMLCVCNERHVVLLQNFGHCGSVIDKKRDVVVPCVGANNLIRVASRTGFIMFADQVDERCACLLYTSPSPRDATLSRMPSSA